MPKNIATYGCVCLGGNLTKQNSRRLGKIIKKGGGTVKRKQDSFEILYNKTSGKNTERLTSRRHKPTQGGIQQQT